MSYKMLQKYLADCKRSSREPSLKGAREYRDKVYRERLNRYIADCVIYGWNKTDKGAIAYRNIYDIRLKWLCA